MLRQPSRDGKVLTSHFVGHLNRARSIAPSTSRRFFECRLRWAWERACFDDPGGADFFMRPPVDRSARDWTTLSGGPRLACWEWQFPIDSKNVER
jgi:hypothetical protein